MVEQRILFDGYWLASGPPSGRNVVQSLVEGWARAFPGDTITVAVPSEPTVKLPTNVKIVEARPRFHNHGAWVMGSLPRLIGPADVMITQNFAPRAGRRRATTVTFVHDAIFRDHPEWFTLPERAYLSAAASSLRWADVVATSSRAEASRISDRLRHAEGKTRSIGLGVPVALTRSTARPPAGSKTDDSFVLAVGRLNVRKNLTRLIEAFLETEQLSKSDLLIVGSANGLADTSAKIQSSSRVKFLGSVSDPELRWLYEHCLAFAFPSLDEGFGLPLIEASYFGARSLASDIPAFVELNVAEKLFEPTSIPTIVEALASFAHRGNRDNPRSIADVDNTWLEVAARLRTAALSAVEVSNA